MRRPRSGDWSRGLVVLGAAVVFISCGPSGPKTLALGEACTPGDTAYVCADELCLALDTSSGFCTRTCNDDCPDDFICQGAGRYGRVCRKLTGCKTEQDCPAGHTCDATTGNCYVKVSRGLCSPCQDVAQCPTGGACFKAVGSGEQFCTGPCAADKSCPTGFVCKGIPAGKDGASIEQCVPANEACDRGKALCAPCQGDDECGGPFDLCVRNVVSGETFCGTDCNPKKNLCATPDCVPEKLDSAANPDCPSGFACTNLSLNKDGSRGPFQCVPNSNSCRGYCTSTDELGQVSECGLGQVCTGNACLPATDGRLCAPCSDNDDCRRGGFTENRCIVNNCANCAFKGESF